MSSMRMRRPMRAPLDEMFTVRRLFQPAVACLHRPARARPERSRTRIPGVEPMRPGISSVISATQSRGEKGEMRSSKPTRARAPVAGDPMARRAARLGVETQYRDVQGRAGGPRRVWPLAAQLYGVRSQRNWGSADFTDLLGLIELAAALGAGGVALNPLHVLFDDRAEAASPYSPSSRLFLNPLY